MENQFLAVIVAHLLAVMSPGPDFALILRQAFMYGRKISIYTSIGIGCGIFFHIAYCLLGIEILLNNDTFEKLLTVLCGFYLFYLGINSILISQEDSGKLNNKKMESNISNFKAFLMGLLTNILNIKATFFFLSLYTFLILEYKITFEAKLFYGLWMAFITGLWFSLVSIFLTNKTFSNVYDRYKFYISKAMGGILIYIAIKIILKLA